MTDEELWRAFTDRTLSDKEWNHRAHLRVAWMYLERYRSLDEAHLRMRVGIIRLNQVHGLEETPQRGYHETLTRVWLMLVLEHRAIDRTTDSLSFIERHHLDKDTPLRLYSRERLMSLEARSVFVPPDLP
jgi:hypothetical protein